MTHNGGDAGGIDGLLELLQVDVNLQKCNIWVLRREKCEDRGDPLACGTVAVLRSL